MVEPEYLTNPNRRCLYCKGREVIKVLGGNVESSLEKVELEGKSIWRCKDRQECRQNIDAENTILNFDRDFKDFKITRFGKTIFEVKKK